MVRIAGGPFTMGEMSDTSAAHPAHRVALLAFEIDRVPVTNADFAAFLTQIGGLDGPRGPLYDLDDPAAKIAGLGTRFVTATGFEQHPVTGDRWAGALAFCTARGARLPTEAEWERAARGPDGRPYPWGAQLPDSSRGRFAYGLLDATRVGSYPAGATPDGVLDMAGNAWQWTSSLYRPYPYRADDGREDLDAPGERVSRGGSAGSTPEMLRATYRNSGMQQLPADARPPVTFRCARDAASTT
jgi:iron(II)-dependent oxidoreductase